MKQTQKSLLMHQPLSVDIFYSLSQGEAWARLLLNKNAKYDGFLRQLIDKEFFRLETRRRTIKSISEDLGIESTKAIKWIKEIYEDIFTLNENDSKAFEAPGIEHLITAKNYDNFLAFSMWLPYIPRIHESFECFFFNAKLGTSNFWVHDVSYEIENGKQKVVVALKGGVLNQHRERLLEQGLFERKITYNDLINLHDFEIDEKLKKAYYG